MAVIFPLKKKINKVCSDSCMLKSCWMDDNIAAHGHVCRQSDGQQRTDGQQAQQCQ